MYIHGHISSGTLGATEPLRYPVVVASVGLDMRRRQVQTRPASPLFALLPRLPRLPTAHPAAMRRCPRRPRFPGSWILSSRHIVRVSIVRQFPHDHPSLLEAGTFPNLFRRQVGQGKDGRLQCKQAVASAELPSARASECRCRTLLFGWIFDMNHGH
ncbi:hypothetical protein BT67DRAFT_295916 [Trichocladium antarcticum]|uniref:Uncharacterized protein n=1 Tax=Trichocladium antarcticum TaxID=1450529 RepID=A0AAN6ZDN1_9PEZI|nr:hypothetical protein BT67DRAFT_295916 [Trichocladium antarcticum]